MARCASIEVPSSITQRRSAVSSSRRSMLSEGVAGWRRSMLSEGDAEAMPIDGRRHPAIDKPGAKIGGVDDWHELSQGRAVLFIEVETTSDVHPTYIRCRNAGGPRRTTYETRFSPMHQNCKYSS